MARQLFLPALSFRRVSAPNVVYSHRSRYKPTRRGEQLVKRILNEIVSKITVNVYTFYCLSGNVLLSEPD